MSRAETTSEPSGTQSIERAAALLRLLAGAGNRGAGLSELVEGSRLAKPTCRRILLALIEAGLVEQNGETRRYFLGPEAYVLGVVAAGRYGIHRLAAEGVHRLAHATGDAAFLQVRRDLSVVCLQREDGDYPIRSHVLAAGDRHPLGIGAGGIALLAALPDDEVEDILRLNASLFAERYRAIPHSLIREQLAEARETGWAINRGTVFPESWGVGMVVRDASGRAEACLSLAAPTGRMRADRLPDLVRLLRDEVRKLELKLRDYSGPDGGFAMEGPARAAPGTGRKSAIERRAS
jgi:DNA-binding IclR family transcriptional regulator